MPTDPVPRNTWVLACVAFVYLVFLGGASNFLPSPQARILTQLVILAAMVGGIVAMRRGAIDIRSPLVLPGLAYVLALAVASTFSQRPAASLEALALLLLAAPAYLVVRGIVWSPSLASRVDGLIIASAGLFTIAYLLQALILWIGWWRIVGPSVPPLRPGDAGLTIGTVNAVALYLEMLVPIAAALAWRAGRRRLAYGLVGIGALALLVTGSRGAWLGVGAGVVVLALLVWVDRGRPMPSLASQGGRGRLVVIAGIGVLAVAVAPLIASRMLAGDAGRIELWSAGWSMVTSSPLVGVGPGSWQGLRPLTPISAANLAVLYTTHDSVLQWLVEGGVLLLAAVGWLVVAAIGAARSTLRRTPEPTARLVILTAIASLAGVGVHSLVDTQWHIPAVVLLTFHLAARLDRPGGEGRTPAPRSALLAATVAVLVGALALVPIDLAMVRAQVANTALDRGDAAVALEGYDAAVALHDLPIYRLGQAIARSTVGDTTGAAESLDRMAALEPFTFVTAQQAILAGDPSVPLHRLDEADPYDATASVNAAQLWFATDRERATTALADAMGAVPTLIPSERPPTFVDDEVWAAAQHRVIDGMTGGGYPGLAAALAMLIDDPDRATLARSLVAPGSPAAEAVALLDVAVRTGSADLDAARALLRRAPTDGDLLYVLWLLAFEVESQRDIDEITTISQVAFFGTPLPPMELVTDGLTRADWSVRLPRYPMAASSRLGPARPYLPGVITIEPVYRPER